MQHTSASLACVSIRQRTCSACALSSSTDSALLRAMACFTSVGGVGWGGCHALEGRADHTKFEHNEVVACKAHVVEHREHIRGSVARAHTKVRFKCRDVDGVFGAVLLHFADVLG